MEIVFIVDETFTYFTNFTVFSNEGLRYFPTETSADISQSSNNCSQSDWTVPRVF